MEELITKPKLINRGYAMCLLTFTDDEEKIEFIEGEAYPFEHLDKDVSGLPYVRMYTKKHTYLTIEESEFIELFFIVPKLS